MSLAHGSLAATPADKSNKSEGFFFFFFLFFFREENAAHCLVSRRVATLLGIVEPTPVTNLFRRSAISHLFKAVSLFESSLFYFRASSLLEYNRIRHDSLANAIDFTCSGVSKGCKIEKGRFPRGGSPVA